MDKGPENYFANDATGREFLGRETEEMPMDDTEFRCYQKCDARNEQAIMFDRPEKCFCGSHLKFFKIYFPKKYREKMKGMKK